MTPAPHPDDHAIPECIRVFNESEFARLLGMVITEARDGYARVEMDSAGKMNPSGVAHGGAIFSIADQAFGIAANCSGVHRVAVSASMLYLVPATGMLVAVAERVADNGATATFRVMVSDGSRPVAEFTGIAFRV
jgi:acyl-CoA thioesterase